MSAEARGRSVRPRTPRVVGSVRGFTLVELMAVVLVMGILATLGFVAIGRHRSAAKGVEAVAMVQSIRAAQERWRAEHMAYLDVTSDERALYPRDPRAAERDTVQAFFYPLSDVSHPDNARWVALRPTVTGPVLFGYTTDAGHAGDTPPAPLDNEAASDIDYGVPTESWYVIEAVGDVDWDGVSSYYLATSFTDLVLRMREGE